MLLGEWGCEVLITLSQKDNAPRNMIDIPNVDKRTLRSYIESLAQMRLLRAPSNSNGEVAFSSSTKPQENSSLSVSSDVFLPNFVLFVYIRGLIFSTIGFFLKSKFRFFSSTEII